MRPVYVELAPAEPAPLRAALDPGRRRDLDRDLAAAVPALAGRTVWHVNSTARGGGVAELLRAVLPYWLAAGVAVRWGVMAGDAEFFAITKRLCGALYGSAGDGGRLGPSEQRHFAAVTRANEALLEPVRPGDVVVLHDPQTAGLAGAAARRGAAVVWRCHVGSDVANEHTASGWAFLDGFLAPVGHYVFSIAGHVPAALAGARVTLVPPVLDPAGPKNRHLDAGTVRRLLARADLVADAGLPAGAAPAVPRARVEREGPAPPPDEPLVVQVSRWDRLKDMHGVLRAFAGHVAAHQPGTLLLAGPDAEGVDDDPEGAAFFRRCRDDWRRLPAATRRRVHLAQLPMDDLDANALVVNALQRHATVVTQKSLAEGFGLTVTEAMWKARPVVAGRVGGIAEQITGDDGVLVDPLDDAAFGTAVRDLLADPVRAAQLGARARQRVRAAFLPDTHLRRYLALLTGLSAAPRSRRAP